VSSSWNADREIAQRRASLRPYGELLPPGFSTLPANDVSSPPRLPAANDLPGSPPMQWSVVAVDSLPLPLPALHFAFPEGGGGGVGQSHAIAGAATAPIASVAPTVAAATLRLILSIPYLL
jgi:hypothetical protein